MGVIVVLVITMTDAEPGGRWAHPQQVSDCVEAGGGRVGTVVLLGLVERPAQNLGTA